MIGIDAPLTLLAIGCGIALLMIGVTVWKVRVEARDRVRNRLSRWNEPMPWECSDYTPPARVTVQADFIEKE